MAATQEIPHDELKEIASGIALSVMSFINIQLGDLLTPVAPLEIMKVKDSGLERHTDLTILAWKRSRLDKPALQCAVDQYVKLLSSESALEGEREKLHVALGLYAAHFYERAATTRFLTLVMVLESLALANPRPKPIVDLLNRWKQEVDSLKAQLDQKSEEFAALEGIERELLFKRQNSIRSQIRQLVKDVLGADGNPDASELARQAVRVYDKRSSLVHEGKLSTNELTKAEKTIKEIVDLVLKAKFRLAQL